MLAAMALTSEDVDTIGRLLDERLARAQAVDRRRRRFWLWFWIALFVLSSVASWFAAQQMLRKVEAQLADIDSQFLDTKLTYQRQLARDVQMQQERKAAEQAANYQPKQSQADYESGLMRSAFKAMSQQAALSKKMEQLDGDDPEALIQATEEMSSNLTTMLGALTQVMLRNTDPALNTPQEKLLAGGDGGGPAVPQPATTVTPIEPALAR